MAPSKQLNKGSLMKRMLAKAWAELGKLTKAVEALAGHPHRPRLGAQKGADGSGQLGPEEAVGGCEEREADGLHLCSKEEAR